jgi:hypothetical protein
MPLLLEPHRAQRSVWPATGRHILAQFDDDSIVVYQAYKPSIGHYAAAHGRFGGEFSFSRMTWLKPNFLWMMYRSGWGTKSDQEVTLAIRVRRSGFEALLEGAVFSSHQPEVYASENAWKAAVASSSVRLQWDPDHDPAGVPQERRAIQLGIRGDVLRKFNEEWILAIEDVSALVAAQRDRPREELETPRERVYPVPEPLRQRLGML